MFIAGNKNYIHTYMLRVSILSVLSYAKDQKLNCYILPHCRLSLKLLVHVGPLFMHHLFFMALFNVVWPVSKDYFFLWFHNLTFERTAYFSFPKNGRLFFLSNVRLFVFDLENNGYIFFNIIASRPTSVAISVERPFSFMKIKPAKPSKSLASQPAN